MSLSLTCCGGCSNDAKVEEDYTNMLETLIGIACVDVSDKPTMEHAIELASKCLDSLKHPAGIKHNAEMFRS